MTCKNKNYILKYHKWIIIASFIFILMCVSDFGGNIIEFNYNSEQNTKINIINEKNNNINIINRSFNSLENKKNHQISLENLILPNFVENERDILTLELNQSFAAAIDFKNNIHLAWKKEKEIYYTLFNTTFNNWSETILISTESTAGTNDPTIDVDNDGNVHIAWVDYNEYPIVKSDKTSEVNIVYRQFNITSKIWSPTFLISSESDQPSYCPKLKIDSKNNIHIVWDDFSNIYDSGPDRDIFYRIFNSSTRIWTETSVITTGSKEAAESTQIDIDQSDCIHLIWSEGGKVLYTHRNSLSGIWSDKEVATEDYASNPIIAVDSNGIVHLTFHDRAESGNICIFYKIRNNQNIWTERQKISKDIEHAYWASVAVDKEDNVHVVWYEYLDGKNTTIVYSTLTDGLWTEPQTFPSEPNGKYSFPKIFIDNGGKVYIMWIKEDIKPIKSSFYSTPWFWTIIIIFALILYKRITKMRKKLKEKQEKKELFKTQKSLENILESDIYLKAKKRKKWFKIGLIYSIFVIVLWFSNLLWSDFAMNYIFGENLINIIMELIITMGFILALIIIPLYLRTRRKYEATIKEFEAKAEQLTSEEDIFLQLIKKRLSFSKNLNDLVQRNKTLQEIYSHLDQKNIIQNSEEKKELLKEINTVISELNKELMEKRKEKIKSNIDQIFSKSKILKIDEFVKKLDLERSEFIKMLINNMEIGKLFNIDGDDISLNDFSEYAPHDEYFEDWEENERNKAGKI